MGTAMALQVVQSFATTNAGTTSALSDAWQDSAHIVNRAFAEAQTDVAGPLGQFSSRVEALNSGGNCSVVRASYLAGVEVLGQSFVAAHFMLTACCGILAFCGMGLSLLYCFLWSIRQEGH